MAGSKPIQGPFSKMEPDAVRMANEFNLRAIPDDPIATVAELVGVARQLDDITDPPERRGGGLYVQAGPKEDALKSVAVLAWGQDIWVQIEASANVASPDGPEIVTAPRESAEEREHRKARQGKETVVEEPGVATMALSGQPNPMDDAAAIAAGMELASREPSTVADVPWSPPPAKRDLFAAERK